MCMYSVFLNFTVFISFQFELGTVGSTSPCVNLVRYRNARLDHLSVLSRSHNHRSKSPFPPQISSAMNPESSANKASGML
ncbi:hypothetical protein FJTKL_08844 [Diaporthe vaccinii]|uniref:Secreted protein n=1 Tax=Diaporthe vaccinii TaxID=105482 RepID=A0ABR4EPQ1_9PEZI